MFFDPCRLFNRCNYSAGWVWTLFKKHAVQEPQQGGFWYLNRLGSTLYDPSFSWITIVTNGSLLCLGLGKTQGVVPRLPLQCAPKTKFHRQIVATVVARRSVHPWSTNALLINPHVRRSKRRVCWAKAALVKQLW